MLIQKTLMIIEQKKIHTVESLQKIVDDNAIRFFDFGCSHGNGMMWVQNQLGCSGLGFDIIETKLLSTSAKDLLCSRYDILKLPDQKLVPFTTLFHMLEHLNSKWDAYEYIEKAVEVSTEYVIMKQPYYDADPFLFSLGMKTFYSDWTGHRNHMVTNDFYFILEKLRREKKIAGFAIRYNLPILSSDDKKIHPLSSARDSHDYDSEHFPEKKKNIVFNFPMFYEIQVAIDVSGSGYGQLWQKLGTDPVVYDSKTANLSIDGDISL